MADGRYVHDSYNRGAGFSLKREWGGAKWRNLQKGLFGSISFRCCVNVVGCLPHVGDLFDPLVLISSFV